MAAQTNGERLERSKLENFWKFVRSTENALKVISGCPYKIDAEQPENPFNVFVIK